MEESIRAGRSIFLEGDEAGIAEEILDDETRCLDLAEDVDGLDEEGIESKSAMGDEERSSGAADLNGEEVKEDGVVKSGGKPGPKKRAGSEGPASSAKKPKKKTKNVWAKGWKRKAGKKANGKAQAKNVENENSVHITPVTRNMEKVEDGPEMPILLSKIHKAERVELSSDRLSAGSTKGYRMVRATRGVVEGAWYFEITLEKLGPTGHTRLGWCTQKGDVQAPVGYDTHGYSYRDVDGSKVHAALREPYGEQYMEGDVIGFYINLPGGASLAPPPQEIVNYKGSAWTVEAKEEPSKPVPGSQICFLRNGKYQGVAFKDIYAGRYYPAASMYTLPNEPNCTVRFNFGPKFKFEFPNISSHPSPQPMSSARYCTLDGKEIEPAVVNTDQPDKSNDATQLSSEMAEPEKSENSGEYDLEKQQRSSNDQVISNSLVHVAVHSAIDITLNGQY